DWRFLGLLVLSTVLDYWFGLALDRTPEGGPRTKWLIASLVVNLGILGVFKYLNFFVDSLQRVLSRLGLDYTAPALRVLLPIGISFYTFHGISYVFDVYRGHIRSTKNLLDYSVFVAFFPQLVAGPIGRATLQLPQFENDRVAPDREQRRSALFLILLGLFKKVVIADGVAGVANSAFAIPGQASSVSLLLGAYAFSLQIYGDFSGYSDIARGSARLLGVELPLNFTEPYLSRNITEFWRRWHISLSNWLRDYLYLPLGGNRGSELATYRNLFLVMLIGGLWHGASWTFVIWGGLHGVALGAHRYWSRRRAGRDLAAPDDAGTTALLSRLLTFHLVTALWIVFRAPSFDAARSYAQGLVEFRSGAVNLDDALVVVVGLAATLTIDLLQRRVRRLGPIVVDRRPLLRDVGIGSAVVALIVLSGGVPVPFIYFQF
ncbi:MAG: MBOAT family protein, partial [Actinomycetota bacterium]|nr:MBOAT family protein [Actinomycetota bacterium]